MKGNKKKDSRSPLPNSSGTPRTYIDKGGNVKVIKSKKTPFNRLPPYRIGDDGGMI